MRLSKEFDSGVLPPFEIDGNTVRFDLRPRQKVLNALVQDAPQSLNVELLVDDNGERFVLDQGLIFGGTRREYNAAALIRVEDGLLRATVETTNGEVRVATRYPYGRDALEQLICETAGESHCCWSILPAGSRGLPIVQFGKDNGSGPIHCFIAGEDAWETAGSWVADAMIRELARNTKPVRELLLESMVFIVPLVSPYSATTDKPSYCTMDGKGIYGAATWADDDPPPEYLALRKLVEHTIEQGRLGFMMTIHSWQASYPNTGLATIRSAGDNTLSDDRRDWAAKTMERMIDGVPQGDVQFPDTIWHPGLARDYLLAVHNAITFRVEITTAGQGLDSFQETGRRFVENLTRITDWAPVLEAGAE